MNYDVDIGKNLARKKGDYHETGVESWRTCQINRINGSYIAIYDKIGLLPSGYRIYTESDIAPATNTVNEGARLIAAE